MRVAYFIESLPSQTDGVASTFAHLTHHLERFKIEYRLFVPFVPSTLAWRNRVTQIRSVPMSLFPDQLQAQAIRQDAYQKLDRFNPHLIHVSNTSLLGLLGMNYAQDRGLPLVASYHAGPGSTAAPTGSPSQQWGDWDYLRWFGNSCNATLVPSSHEAFELNQRGIRNVQIWRPGVDTERFNPKLRASVANSPDVTPTLFCKLAAGQEHRLELLIAACRILRAKGLKFHLYVASTRPVRAEVKEQVPNARFVVYQSVSDLARLYAGADIFVLPDGEATNATALLEAAASGLPSVGFRIGWAADLIEDGVTGLLATLNNPTDFAARIAMLLLDPQLRRMMGSKARNEAEYLDWKYTAYDLIECYAKLIAAGHDRLTPGRVNVSRRNSAAVSPIPQLAAA